MYFLSPAYFNSNVNNVHLTRVETTWIAKHYVPPITTESPSTQLHQSKAKRSKKLFGDLTISLETFIDQ